MDKFHLEAKWKVFIQAIPSHLPELLLRLDYSEWEAAIMILSSPKANTPEIHDFAAGVIHHILEQGAVAPIEIEYFPRQLGVNPTLVSNEEILYRIQSFIPKLNEKGIWQTIQPDGDIWNLYDYWNAYAFIYSSEENWIAFLWETSA